jgi:MFS family permease
MKFRHIYYGWIITFTSAAILGIQAIPMNTFGVFLVPLTTQFAWGRGALSGASSVSSIVGGFLGVLIGRLSDKYGPRALVMLSGLLVGIGLLLMSLISSLWQVYLIWGFFIGIGGSCCFTPIVSTIPRWFASKRGMALGIVAAGSALGGVIFPLLAQGLISSYGWRQPLFLLGLIVFIIIPLALLLKQSPEKMGVNRYGENGTIQGKQPIASASGLSFKQAIKASRFWVFAPVHICFLFSTGVIFVHIVPYAVDMGTLPMAAASILSIIAGSSIIGNLSMGFISDKVGGKIAFSACLAVATLSLIWLLFASETWMFYLFAVVFGLAWGGTSPLVTVVTAELFGLKSLGVILGSIMLIGTIGGSLGAPLAGIIFDKTESYSLAFSICVILSAIAIIFSLILLRYKAEGSKA